MSDLSPAALQVLRVMALARDTLCVPPGRHPFLLFGGRQPGLGRRCVKDLIARGLVAEFARNELTGAMLTLTSTGRALGEE